MPISSKRKLLQHGGSALAAALLASASMAAGPAPSTRIVLGGAGGWDYLTFDKAHGRLFITRGTHVQVIDTAQMRLEADIPGTDGAHGVALAPEKHLGYASNGKSDSVTVFDLETLSVVDEIHDTGKGPDAILYDPDNRRVLTFNSRSHDASVIDAGTRRVIATIPLSGKPEFAVRDGRGAIFVNIEDKGSLVRIDAATSTVTAEWTLSGCKNPSGLAIDATSRRLFSVCENRKMIVTDADSGKTVAVVPIGGGSDAAAFDTTNSLVLSSNGEGTLSVIREVDADHYVPVATVPTQRGARTMAIDESTQHAYLATADFLPPPVGASAPAARPVPVPATFSLIVVDYAGH